MQHAAHPVAGVRIGGRWVGHAGFAQAALLARRQVQDLPAPAEAHAAFLHADLALHAVLPHTKARRRRFDIAQAGADDEGARLCVGSCRRIGHGIDSGASR
ncbi:hypothetical protein D3C71_1772200 [compost metagenome]